MAHKLNIYQLWTNNKGQVLKYLCFTLFMVGILGPAWLVVLKRSNFIDENAFTQQALEGLVKHMGYENQQVLGDLTHFLLESLNNKEKQISKNQITKYLLTQQLQDLGLELSEIVYQAPLQQSHIYELEDNQQVPQNSRNNKLQNKVIRQQDNQNKNSSVFHTIVPTKRGNGKEAILIVTPLFIDLDDLGPQAASQVAQVLSLGLTLCEFLQRINWLSKDIVWTLLDKRYDQTQSLTKWIQQYQDIPRNDDITQMNFVRSGALQQALIVDLDDLQYNYVNIKVLGQNGLLPQLDIYQLLNEGTQELGLRNQQSKGSKLKDMTTKLLIQNLGVQNKFILDAIGSYMYNLQYLINFLNVQATGQSTGPHSALKPYTIDSVTIQTQYKEELGQSKANYIQLFGILVYFTRGCSNLLEKLHHSYYLYLMPDDFHFISIDMYIIPFSCLIASIAFMTFAMIQEIEEARDSYVKTVILQETPKQNDEKSRKQILEILVYQNSNSVKAWGQALGQTLLVQVVAYLIGLILSNWTQIYRCFYDRDFQLELVQRYCRKLNSLDKQIVMVGILLYLLLIIVSWCFQYVNRLYRMVYSYQGQPSSVKRTKNNEQINKGDSHFIRGAQIRRRLVMQYITSSITIGSVGCINYGAAFASLSYIAFLYLLCFFQIKKLSIRRKWVWASAYGLLMIFGFFAYCFINNINLKNVQGHKFTLLYTFGIQDVLWVIIVPAQLSILIVQLNLFQLNLNK